MSGFYDYRLKFSKNGPIRFVGHLDVMRYMQKANRRAGLPMRYSEGFSPHQILSFALPLSVGATSDGEYLDMSLVEEMAPEEITARLNAVMREGIEARACVRLPEHSPKAMTVIAAASYRLRVADEAVRALTGEAETPEARAAFAGALRAHLSGDAIRVTKRTKRGEREVDVKPLIHEWRVGEDGTLTALLHAGSKDHVKPAFLYEGLWRDASMEFPAQALTIHRTDLYEERDGGFVPLIGSGRGRN